MAGRPPADPAAKVRAANVRTAAILFVIAAVFFVGIIGSRFLGGQAAGIGVLGGAAVLFLVVAIGRNLLDKH